MRCALVLFFLATASALHVQRPKLALPVREAQAACIGAALCSAALLANPTQATAVSRAEEMGIVQRTPREMGINTEADAVAELTAATYPIIAHLDEKTFAPFVTDVANLIIKERTPAYKANLAKSVDLGLDWFLSIPDPKVKDVELFVKNAFDGLSPDTCTLVPLPPASLFDKVVRSPAFAAADPAKVKAFEAEAKGVVGAFASARSGDRVCLPTVKKTRPTA